RRAHRAREGCQAARRHSADACQLAKRRQRSAFRKGRPACLLPTARYLRVACEPAPRPEGKLLIFITEDTKRRITMASVAKREWEYKGEKRSCWVVRYTDQSGKKRLKTFESKKNADSFRNKVSFDLERGEHHIGTGEMKFNDAVESSLLH